MIAGGPEAIGLHMCASGGFLFLTVRKNDGDLLRNRSGLEVSRKRVARVGVPKVDFCEDI